MELLAFVGLVKSNIDCINEMNLAIMEFKVICVLVIGNTEQFRSAR
jgi:hypothetical protein